MSSFTSSSQPSTGSETARLLLRRRVKSLEFPTPMSAGPDTTHSLQRETAMSDDPTPMAPDSEENPVSVTGASQCRLKDNGSTSVQIQNKMPTKEKGETKETSACAITVTTVVASVSKGLVVSGTDMTGSLTKYAASEPPASALKNAKTRRKISYSEEESRKSLQNTRLQKQVGGSVQVHSNDIQNIIDSFKKGFTMVSKGNAAGSVPGVEVDTQISSVEIIKSPINASIDFPLAPFKYVDYQELGCVDLSTLREVNQMEPNGRCVKENNELMRKSVQDQNGIKEPKPSNSSCLSVSQSSQVQPTDRAVRRVTRSVGQQLGSSETGLPWDRNKNCPLIKAHTQKEKCATRKRSYKRARKLTDDEVFEPLPVKVSKSKQQSNIGSEVGGTGVSNMNSRKKPREVKSGDVHLSGAQSKKQQSVDRTKDNNSNKFSPKQSIQDDREPSAWKSKKMLLQKYCHEEADQPTELHVESDPHLYVSSPPATPKSRTTKKMSGLASLDVETQSCVDVPQHVEESYMFVPELPSAQEPWERSTSPKGSEKSMHPMHYRTPQSVVYVSLATSTKDNIDGAPVETAEHNFENTVDKTDKLSEDSVSTSSGFKKKKEKSKRFEHNQVPGTNLHVSIGQLLNKSNIHSNSNGMEHKVIPTCRVTRNSTPYSDMKDIAFAETKLKPSSVALRKSSTFTESTLSDFEDESVFFSLKKPFVDDQYLEDISGGEYEVVDDNEIGSLKSLKVKQHTIIDENIVDMHPKTKVQSPEEKVGPVVSDTKVVDNQNIVTLNILDTSATFQTEETTQSKHGCKTRGKKKNANKKFVDSLRKYTNKSASERLPKRGHIKKRPSFPSNINALSPLVPTELKSDDWSDVTLSDEAAASTETNKSTQEEEMGASRSFNFDELISGELESAGLPSQRVVLHKTSQKQDNSSQEIKEGIQSILKRGRRSSLGTPKHYCEVTFSEPPISARENIGPLCKIIKPTNSPEGLRRSQRTRVKPLEWYKNERILYKKRQSGGFVVDGVGPPICKNERECNYMARMMSAKQKLTAYGKRLKTARQKAKRLSIHTSLPANMKFVDTEGEIPVINPSSGEECIINCVASKNSYVYTGPSGLEPAPGDALMIAKPIRQLAFGCGELIIKPLMEKLTQFVNSDTLVFYVVKGKVAVTIHQTTSLLDAGSSFFVPRGNTYGIKNLRRNEAKLAFFQMKNEIE